MDTVIEVENPFSPIWGFRPKFGPKYFSFLSARFLRLENKTVSLSLARISQRTLPSCITTNCKYWWDIALQTLNCLIVWLDGGKPNFSHLGISSHVREIFAFPSFRKPYETYRSSGFPRIGLLFTINATHIQPFNSPGFSIWTFTSAPIPSDCIPSKDLARTSSFTPLRVNNQPDSTRTDRTAPPCHDAIFIVKEIEEVHMFLEFDWTKFMQF